MNKNIMAVILYMIIFLFSIYQNRWDIASIAFMCLVWADLKWRIDNVK